MLFCWKKSPRVGANVSHGENHNIDIHTNRIIEELNLNILMLNLVLKFNDFDVKLTNVVFRCPRISRTHRSVTNLFSTVSLK